MPTATPSPPKRCPTWARTSCSPGECWTASSTLSARRYCCIPADEEGDWTLVGTSFVLPLNVVGPDHPDAFAGPLDNWHVHYELCTGSDFNSRSSTEQECREDGGTWVPVYGWMIHAWVWKDNPLGVFNMWNPNVEPVAPASAVREAVSVGGEFTVPIENFDYGEATVTVGGEPDLDQCRWSWPYGDGGRSRPLVGGIRLGLRCAGRFVRAEVRRTRSLRLHVHAALVHVGHGSCDSITLDRGG